MASDAGVKPQKDINRLKAQVKRLQKDKEKAFPELGRATYQAFMEGRLTDQALKEGSERLKGFDTEIESSNAEIARLQDVVQQMKVGTAPPAMGLACPSCAAPVTPGLRFCGNCGTPLAVQPPAPPAGTVCPVCGSPMAAGAKFCGECGHAMEAAPPPAPPAVPAPVPPAPMTPPPPSPAAPPTAEKGKCPSCGAVAEDEGAAFCGECGAKL